MEKIYTIRETREFEHTLILDIPENFSEERLNDILRNVLWEFKRNGFERIWKEIPNEIEYSFEEAWDLESTLYDLDIYER